MKSDPLRTGTIFEILFPIPRTLPFDYLAPEGAEIDEASAVGRRVKVPFGYRTAVGVVTRVKSESAAGTPRLKPISEFLDAEPILNSAALSLAGWMAGRYACSVGEALFALMPPGKENPISFKDPSPMGESPDHFHASSDRPVLTPEQAHAVEILHEAVFGGGNPLHRLTMEGAGLPAVARRAEAGGGKKSFLLLGVAAAGKTEVYLSLIKDVLAQGKRALVLVPEIGLSHQMTRMIQDRFGATAVINWHSDMSLKKRVEDWWRIKRGEFSVVVGVRSAILSPIPHIGAIIVDEEHDSAYKEDRKPRFHVREVAARRAEQEGALLLYGSATPSLEIMKDSLEGRVELIEIAHRATRASAPTVHLVDMNQEKGKWNLSGKLCRALEDRLAKKEQAILFLNKRGFERFLRCPHCGWVAQCEQCGVTLVQHKGAGPSKLTNSKFVSLEGPAPALVCHYCAKHTAPPAACPSCGQKKLFAGGSGTQRVEENVKSFFPSARVLRWDRDAAQGTGGHEKLYQSFLNGEYDILIGTQVVAQGFNFPNVTLVGVLDADVPLYLPDYRAAERAFQTLTHVAGRAGRELVTGDVIVQTRHPDHYALRYAINMDFNGFAKEELEHRRVFNYPPYTHLVKVVAASKAAGKAEPELERLLDWGLDTVVPKPLGFLGPGPVKRKSKGRPQCQLIFKIAPDHLALFLNELQQFKPASGVAFSLFVDPE